MHLVEICLNVQCMDVKAKKSLEIDKLLVFHLSGVVMLLVNIQLPFLWKGSVLKSPTRPHLG